MLSSLLKILIFGFINLSTALGQSKKIVIGTIESNFEDGKPNKENPFIGVTHFYKSNNEWGVLYDSLYAATQIFKIYSNGKKVGQLSSEVDTTIYRKPYFWFPYKFKNKKIPTVGQKSYVFSGMGGEKCYRPLIITNSNYSAQKNIPAYKKSNKKDSLLVLNYLIETAKSLKLGNLDSIRGQIINRVNGVLEITKDCYFIDADINLNMYCYQDEVPFDTELSYFMKSTQKYGISQRKETSHSFFLVNKSKVKYIDYGLKYLDSGDFDNDGYEEIIFRMDKYNYSAYLMVTNKWMEFLTNGWSYH